MSESPPAIRTVVAPSPKAPLEDEDFQPILDTATDLAENLIVRTALRKKVRSGDFYLHEEDVLRSMTGYEGTDISELSAQLQKHSYRARVPRRFSDPMRRNLILLAQVFCLSMEGRRVLEFLVALRLSPSLKELAQELGNLTIRASYVVVAAATHMPPPVVERELESEGTLARSGVVTRDEGESQNIDERFVLHPRLIELVERRTLSEEEVLATLVPRAPVPELGPHDYVELKAEFEMVTRLLGEAVRQSEPGVHVFLHGPTGTGKTELARAVAAHLEVDLFEVVGAQPEMRGAAVARERLTSMVAAQGLLAERKAILLLDEAEDLFEKDFIGRMMGHPGRDRMSASKQWIGRLLEEAKTPMIWIINDLSRLDPALLRRFAYVLRVPEPYGSARRRIWERYLGQECDAGMLDNLATDYELSAAHIASIARSALLVGVAADDEVVHELARSKAPGSLPRHRSPPEFIPGLTQADTDLEKLVVRLASIKKIDEPVSLCLSGPPGTGKSALAAHIASRSNRPLARYNVSDLASKWVGETEQKIAAAFQKAERSGAVLLFDEADTFLRDRRLAVRSWEISTANEFLQQIEASKSITVLTTNLASSLDQALLRRLLLHVNFDYLPISKAWPLFERLAAAIHVDIKPEDVSELRRDLSRIRNITPGDFAAIARRMRLLGADFDAFELVSTVRALCHQKNEGSTAAGFAIDTRD